MGLNESVNFHIAKLLKEKGFVFRQNETYHNPVSGFTKYEEVPPTIADVVMWFYEKHGIWISVHCTSGIKSFWYELRGVESIWFTGENHNSPEEAYEAAFTHLLNNVI